MTTLKAKPINVTAETLEEDENSFAGLVKAQPEGNALANAEEFDENSFAGLVKTTDLDIHNERQMSEEITKAQIDQVINEGQRFNAVLNRTDYRKVRAQQKPGLERIASDISYAGETLFKFMIG